MRRAADLGSRFLRLVLSIQGSQPIAEATYGHPDLADQLRTLGLESGLNTGRRVELECQVCRQIIYHYIRTDL